MDQEEVGPECGHHVFWMQTPHLYHHLTSHIVFLNAYCELLPSHFCSCSAYINKDAFSEFICYTDIWIDTFTWTDCIVKMTGILPVYTDGGPRQNVTELVSSETRTQIWNCDLHMVFSALKPVEGGGVRGRKEWQLFCGGRLWRKEIAAGLFVHTSL